MFGIGGGELIFIIIVALMLFGTDKIPEVARTIAKVVAQLKNASNDLKSEIQKSADEHGINDTVKQITSNFNAEVDKVKNSVIENHGNAISNLDKDNEISKPINELKQNLDDVTGPIKRQL